MVGGQCGNLALRAPLRRTAPAPEGNERDFLGPRPPPVASDGLRPRAVAVPTEPTFPRRSEPIHSSLSVSRGLKRDTRARFSQIARSSSVILVGTWMLATT